jgi:hypothetical protein
MEKQLKEFQLIHVSAELGARSCMVTEQDIKMDLTIPSGEVEEAMKLQIGEKMLLHYGKLPVKTGNLIRKA